MFQITINEKGGQATSQSFDKNEITIGRVQGNDVVLPKGNISKRHSRIVLKDGKFIIVDLKSTNGTYVNGKKITAPQVIKATDKIYIGDYTLQLANGAGVAASVEAAAPSARPKGARSDEIDLFGGDAAADDASPAAASAKAGSPGLIDDNFDQEFDAPGDAPQPKTTKPAALPAKGKLPAAKAPEPEPPEPDPDVDRDLDQDPDPELDLGGGPPLNDEPEAGSDQDDDLEDDLDDEPELPKAPVVPIAAKGPKKPAAAASSSRPSTSRRPAQPTPAPAPAKSKAPIAEPNEDEDLFDEQDDSDEVDAPAATARPEPVVPVRPGPSAVVPARETPAPTPVAAPAPREVAPVVLHPVGPGLAPQLGPPLAAVDRQPAIQAIHLAVVDELGLRGSDLGALIPMRDQVLAAARGHAHRMQSSGRLNPSEDLEQIAKEVTSRAVDVELIAPLYKDESVVQITITHDRQVWAEREALKPEPGVAPTESQIIDLIRCLGVLGGASPGPDNPLVDVRLRDGARVVGVLPPLAFRGPTLSIRKATRDAYNLESFVEAGTLSEEMARFVELCIRSRKNMLLSLGSGVSGSATLNAIASAIADDERVVTIESGVEIHVHNLKNVTMLEPTKTTGVPQLIRHAMALQPDHVIVGTLHGSDIVDLLTAFAGPLDGSVASYFASSPAEAIDRLAGVELATRFEGAPQAAKRLVASAFPIVLQETRFAEGGLRRITSISELVLEGAEVKVHDVFLFRPESIDDNGVLNGTFGATGYEPRFVQELVDRGEQVDMDIFKE